MKEICWMIRAVSPDGTISSLMCTNETVARMEAGWMTVDTGEAVQGIELTRDGGDWERTGNTFVTEPQMEGAGV